MPVGGERDGRRGCRSGEAGEAVDFERSQSMMSSPWPSVDLAPLCSPLVDQQAVERFPTPFCEPMQFAPSQPTNPVNAAKEFTEFFWAGSVISYGKKIVDL